MPQHLAVHTIGQITLVYRGETQLFNTVSLAARFLQQDRIKVGWFHTINATVNLVADGEVSQTRHLKGNKFLIMKQLVQLENETKPANG